jgi:L-amino acid N-acyltransferase YncA
MSDPHDITVRLARLADAPAITAIYNQGIEERNATFETEPRMVEQVTAQLAEKGEHYPTVVVERAGQVVAWASAGLYRSRPCYAGIAEHSVYVERRARGTGVGRVALARLCDVYTDLGFWKLVSRIFPENVASLALHERVGFRVVGVYCRHGKVDGVWRDCVIVEKLLGDAAEATLESDALSPAGSLA